MSIKYYDIYNSSNIIERIHIPWQFLQITVNYKKDSYED